MPVHLSPAEYREAMAAHEARADAWVTPHLERRARGQHHPVWDFLFDYYWLRPTHLRRWHPGLGRVLDDAATTPHATWRDYRVEAAVDGSATVGFDAESFMARHGVAMEEIRGLLRGVDKREPHFDCFGLHEWAMVYRTDRPRHNLPLRLGRAGTDAVVESHQLKCTHYDAFRFFTKPARPLNLTVLTREGQADNDRAGCVHVAMDLYKWATKLGPAVPGELLLDTFALARQARKLDMEASPYDCRELGFGVVPIETAEGKAEYVRRQRELAAAAEPLRLRLVALLDQLIDG
ncbi:3-methyladenine DNA glycosylase [Corynebacterium sp. HMSC074A01]|uniref:3-methyladenine DNA glycosylase n=1 Tax=Corynebacterium sp. HMSC074A01 TaxID=1715030 RepID=UPI0008A480C4|nr:3-methyladenine DNA glycosylase [Corynebacterium sp. HMSC074A01]OHF39142.1 3-methyladenine DNA glycosylase [Corynebacterium sp. HMSC074A01]